MHVPAVVNDLADDVGDICGFDGSDALGVQARLLRVVRVTTEHGDCRPRADVGSVRRQRGIWGLQAARSGVVLAAVAGAAHQRTEHRVDPRHDRCCRSEVDVQAGRLAALEAESLPRVAVQLDVGPPEAVDGLLRIADEEQLARRRLEPVPGRAAICGACRIGRQALLAGGDEHGNFDLDGVGVLELVEHQVAIPAVQRCTRLGRGAQQIARPHQQVMELQAPRRPSLIGCIQGEAGDPLAHRRNRVVDDLGGRGGASLSQLDETRAHRCPVVAPEDSAALRHAAAVEVGLVQHGEALDIGGCCVKAREVLVQLAQQLRGVRCEISRCVPPLQQRRSLLDDAACIERHRLRRRIGHAHPIPIRIECRADVTKRAGVNAGGVDEPDSPGDVGVGQQFVDEAMPSFVKLDVARNLIERLEAGRQPGLDGVLGQNPPSESVQRGDGGAIEPVKHAGQLRLVVLARG